MHRILHVGTKGPQARFNFLRGRCFHCIVVGISVETGRHKPISGKGANEGDMSFEIEDHQIPFHSYLKQKPIFRGFFLPYKPRYYGDASNVQNVRVNAISLQLRQVFCNKGLFYGDAQDLAFVCPFYDGKIHHQIFAGKRDHGFNFKRECLPDFSRLPKRHLKVAIRCILRRDRGEIGITLKIHLF